MRRIHHLRGLLALPFVLSLVACASGPQPIAYGADACDFCRMAISDPRFGGEVVSAKGKVHKFDSAECLASYVVASGDTAVASLWVNDFRHPGSFVDATRARFVRAPGGVSTPMGEAIFAFAPEADGAAEARTLGGTAMTWPEVLALVRSRGHGAPGAPGAPGTPGARGVPGAPGPVDAR